MFNRLTAFVKRNKRTPEDDRTKRVTPPPTYIGSAISRRDKEADPTYQARSPLPTIVPSFSSPLVSPPSPLLVSPPSPPRVRFRVPSPPQSFEFARGRTFGEEGDPTVESGSEGSSIMLPGPPSPSPPPVIIMPPPSGQGVYVMPSQPRRSMSSSIDTVPLFGDESPIPVPMPLPPRPESSGFYSTHSEESLEAQSPVFLRSQPSLSADLLRDLDGRIHDLDDRIRDLDEMKLVIDTLDRALLTANTSHENYGSGVRRLRRWCRDFACLPSSCRPVGIRHIELESEQPLFATAFSDVFRGMYGEKRVAIKSLRVYTEEHYMKSVQKAFLNEVLTWRHLRHPNIVPFLGVCDKSLVCLISEWMAEGTLAGFLQRHPLEHRTSYILGMVRGLDFMHSLGVIHGDIKAINILVDVDHNARLSDFGLASALNQATTAATNMTGGGAKGTLRWIAPELLDAAKPRTHLSDIYALAITIWEVFTSKTPFFQIGNDIVVLNKVLNGERPPKPVDCESVGFSDELWDVVERAWAAEPESRASLADFIKVLGGK